MAQLHPAIGLPCPTFTNPHEMLRRESVWLALVLAVKPPERRRELLLDRVSMAVEERQRRAVAVANASFSVDNENRVGQRVEC